jgi:hypothetical protein
MASAESILFEVNSTNYSNSNIFLIYKPQVGCSGFVTTLRITINLKSITEANFPYIPDETPPDVLQKILDEVALNTPFKEVILYFKKGTGVWVKRAPIKIYNKEPYYDVNLMRFFSDSNTIDVAEDFSLGISLKVEDILAPEDTILVWGSVVEEKKNNGNEELEARIEALELALAGRLTEIPENTLLGRGVGTGNVQLIPNTFVTQAALAQKVGVTGNENIGGIKKFVGQYIGLQSTFPGFWLDELEEQKGAYIVLNGGTLRIQRHTNNFGVYETQLLTLNLTTAELTLPGGKLIIPNMPNTATSLVAGSLWRDGGGFVRIV